MSTYTARYDIEAAFTCLKNVFEREYTSLKNDRAHLQSEFLAAIRRETEAEEHIDRLKQQASKLAEALKSSRTMTEELSRSMDEDHWYKSDLRDLGVSIEQALVEFEKEV